MNTYLKRVLLVIAAISCAGAFACEGEENLDPRKGQGENTGGGDGTDTSSEVGGGGGTDSSPDQQTDSDPIQTTNCAGCSGLFGVDILVVVDDSISMGEEQQILATGFFTLINTLVAPVAGWKYAAADDVRVAVVSSDLGMQYGTQGQASLEACRNKSGCDDDTTGMGDDGAFKAAVPVSVYVDSNHIKCNPDGAQCPDPSWTCNHNGTEGYCVAPGGVAQAQVACPAVQGSWAEYTSVSQIELAKNVACMAQLGINGCGIEQQLQAGVRALQRPDQAAFVRQGYLLAVMVVSDEEDCSMKTNGLFSLPEWNVTSEAGANINIACNYPDTNETNNLFEPRYFRDSLIALKGGDASTVLFAAIVGVPTGAASPCQGTGDNIGACLQDPMMQYVPNPHLPGITDEGIEYEYTHFNPACERMDTSGKVVTSARPGRRFVKVAQEFGCASYVYSICNEDWSEAMREIARLIASCLIV